MTEEIVDALSPTGLLNGVYKLTVETSDGKQTTYTNYANRPRKEQQ